MNDHELRHLLHLILSNQYLLFHVLQKETNAMADFATSLTDLQNQVAQNTSVEQSALTLINGLAAQIQAAGSDPAKIESVVAQMQTSAQALAAAITANTPAAVPPVTPPAPTPTTPPVGTVVNPVTGTAQPA